jgi:multidrug efflux pump subunit AcrA (membrane-fusion protein)
VVEVVVDETPDGLRVAIRPPGAGGGDAAPRLAARAAGVERWESVDLAELIPGWYSVIIDGRSHAVGIASWRAGSTDSTLGGGGPRRWTLVFDGETAGVDIGRSARGRGTAQPGTPAAAGQIRAPMPGLVVAIQAQPGTAVAAGQALIIMEAMKMQMEIRAPHAGVVREVRVAPGQDVAGNDVLATLD